MTVNSYDLKSDILSYTNNMFIIEQIKHPSIVKYKLMAAPLEVYW